LRSTAAVLPLAIVGVSPPECCGVQTGRAVEMWLPLYTQPQVEPRWSPEPPEAGTEPVPHPASLFEARDNWWVLIMGRLKPGTSEQRARDELDVILQQSMAADVGATTKPETLPHLDVEPGSKGLSDLRNEFSMPLL